MEITWFLAKNSCNSLKKVGRLHLDYFPKTLKINLLESK